MKVFSNKVLILSLAILLLLCMQVFAAGSNRAGTNAASELLIPVGAKYIAMGGASIANVQGLEALYWNPAGLDKMEYGAGAMFSHMTYIADINISYLGLATKFGGIGSVGLNFKTLDFGDIPITTADEPDGTGALFSPQFISVGLTYSRMLTNRVAVGVTFKIISETIDRVSATGMAFDFGVQYTDLADIKGLNIGLAIKNLGPGMTFDGNGLLVKADPNDVNRSTSPYKIVAGSDELPSTMEIGVGYQMSMGQANTFDVQTIFINNNYQDDVMAIGGEYAFNKMFFVRGGYNYALENAEDPTGEKAYIFGLTFGAGFEYDLGGFKLALDYAYRDVQYFDANNVFTLKLGF